MRGKRYSEEKIRRQGEGKIKEKWSRTQNRMRWEGRRGKERREKANTDNSRDVKMKAKTERRKNGLNLPLEYQTRDPDEVYRASLRSQETEGSKCALVKAERATSAPLFAVACQSNMWSFTMQRDWRI